MSIIWPKILFVNKYPDMHTYLEICCRKLGEFNSVFSGEAAIQFLQKDAVDILITDVTLGKMNGFELCESIRTHDSWKDMHIILISSMQKSEFQTDGIRAGANVIMDMPFMPSDIREHIKKLCVSSV